MAKYHRQPEHDEHYGPYGAVCQNTGQFDSGKCWICQAKAGDMSVIEASKLILERKTRTGRYEYLSPS